MRYRHAPLLALLVSMLCVPMAHAQDADPQFTLAEPKHEPGNQQTWVYAATLGKETKKGEAFTLRIRIPERVQVEGSGTNVTVTSRRASPHTEVVLTATKNLAEATPVTVTLTGFAADVKHAQRVEYSWRKGEEDYSRIDRVQGPEVFYDPSFMRFVFGAGASRPRDDVIDFKVKDDHLFVVNDSPWRVTGTVGALFKVGQLRSIGKWKMKEAHPIDLLVSLEFAGQTDRVLDGFMFGMAVGLNKQLSVGGGYSLRLGQKLSPRFRRDDDKAWADKYKVDYERFLALASNDELYDGFPLKDPRGDGMKKVFVGDPIINSYNHSWFVGIFIPLDFKDLFASRAD